MKLSYSKSKAMKVFLISTLFVAGGLYFIIFPGEFSRHSLVFTSILGYVTVVFFGLGIYVSIRMFFQKTPGFKMDWNGITYDINKSTTFIAWHEIESFSELKIHNQLLILFHFKDPKGYISREQNFAKKKLMESNYRNHNAPISILPSMYDISLDQLRANLEKYSAKRYDI